MDATNDVDELVAALAHKTGDGPAIIGIDGMDGIGKTPLAKMLATRLGARVISLDDYLEKKRGAYVAFLRIAEIKRALGSHQERIIIEGVCLRAAAVRCNITVGCHLYVRRIGANGLWYDEDICRTLESIDVLKERDRELRKMAYQVAANRTGKDRSSRAVATVPSLAEELIEYHANFKPVEHADVIFDMIGKN